MSELKATPGPWEWEHSSYTHLKQAMTGKHILYYTRDDDGIYCENLADYDLIAAAPDLYAALEACNPVPGGTADRLRRAAMAKARGEAE